MKKKMKAVVAVALAALLAAGAVACDKESDGASATENNNGGNTGDGGNGGNNGGGTTDTTSTGGGSTTVSWVDLGLPSGTLWNSCNLGASSPEEYGDYYAWGEISTKSEYGWDNYKYCRGGYAQLTKYCNDGDYGYNGFTDGLTTLEAADDAATQALGGGARTPTYDEWRELINNTTSEWTTLNGVNGRRFTAANGNSLFLPAAGGRWGDELLYAGEWGHYWSATLHEGDPEIARDFYFYEGYQGVSDSSRYYGHSVRPVRSAR